MESTANGTAKKLFWGFPIEAALYADAKETIVSTRTLASDDLPQGTRLAFDLVSKLVFAGVASYYSAPIQGELPPLAVNVRSEDAAQTVGLGLVFVAGRFLQGRSVHELKDLADYLDHLLRIQPCSGRSCLAFPLNSELENRLRTLLRDIRQHPVVPEFREEIKRLVVDIVEASVAYYFQYSAQTTEPDRHLEQVVQYGIREISGTVEQLAEQMLPNLPPEHLIHFTGYVEAMMFEADEDGAVIQAS